MKKFTKEDDTRWRGLGSIIAFLMFLTFATLLIGTAFGLVTLSAISQPWFLLFSVTILTILAWLFGPDALAAARKSEEPNGD